MKKQYDFVILGAGIAGLSYAFKLKKHDLDFLLIEETNKLGGSWNSHEYQSSIYEFGPNTLISSDELDEIITEIGFEDQVLKKNLKKSRRFLYLKNQLIEVAASPVKMLFSNLLSFKAKLRILMEPFKSKASELEEESVHEFARRKFGEEVATNIVASALQGIWAGDSKKLSAKSALKKIYALEEEHGSIFAALFHKVFSQSKKEKKNKSIISFKNGMQSLTQAIGEYIGEEHIALNCKSKISKQSDYCYQIDIDDGSEKQSIKCKYLIVASQAYKAADLLRPLSLNLYDVLNKIYYAPVFLSAISIEKKLFSRNQKKLFDSFGFIDSKTNHLLLGTIFASELFPERKLQNEFLILNFAGGCRNSQILDFSDADIIDELAGELSEILSPNALSKLSSKDFQLINYSRIEKAIPQYNLGYDKVLKKIHLELNHHKGLDLIGNYLGGVSVPDTIKYSFARFSKLITEIQKTKLNELESKR